MPTTIDPIRISFDGRDCLWIPQMKKGAPVMGRGYFVAETNAPGKEPGDIAIRRVVFLNDGKVDDSNWLMVPAAFVQPLVKAMLTRSREEKGE